MLDFSNRANAFGENSIMDGAGGTQNLSNTHYVKKAHYTRVLSFITDMHMRVRSFAPVNSPYYKHAFCTTVIHM